ncbi:hypothetical protein [Enterococcus hirae]|uniref:hypothetical protein n=1 Tax=Enterococcus hirae TaxID=1354 RepID=UPI0013B371BA|nr:hypothetical protein [Enterococcus hirae]
MNKRSVGSMKTGDRISIEVGVQWMEMIGEIKRWAKTNKIDLLELEKNLTLSPSPENLGQKKIVEGTTRAGGKLERQEEKLGENRHSKDRNQFNGQRTHR